MERDFNWVTNDEILPVVTGVSDSHGYEAGIDTSETISSCRVNQIVDLHHEDGMSYRTAINELGVGGDIEKFAGLEVMLCCAETDDSSKH